SGPVCADCPSETAACARIGRIPRPANWVPWGGRGPSSESVQSGRSDRACARVPRTEPLTPGRFEQFALASSRRCRPHQAWPAQPRRRQNDSSGTRLFLRVVGDRFMKRIAIVLSISLVLVLIGAVALAWARPELVPAWA